MNNSEPSKGRFRFRETLGNLRNTLIRKWYARKINKIPGLNRKWITQGLSACDRARKAWEIRRDRRSRARRMMKEEETEQLRVRDQEKYGDPDGPTFDQLVEKYKHLGFEGDDVYEQIIQSSSRTSGEINQRFGVRQ